jgi:hypothetical protein
MQSTIGYHGDTHPPLPIYFYWVLRHLFAGNATLAGLAVMFITSLAVVPIARTAQAMAGRGAGLAAALLFASSPASLILSGAGIDCVVLLCMALALACVARAALGGAAAWKWSLAAGAVFYVGGLMSFGVISSLVILGSWSLVALWRRHRAWAPFLIEALTLWGLFTAALAACHGLLWAASSGRFDYWKSVATGRWVHLQANQYRTYELWSWANIALYAGYAGVGLVALYLRRAFAALWRADGRDAFLLMSMPFLLTVIFAAFGRAEVQRQFLFGMVVLVLAAAPGLLREDGEPDAPHLLTALALGAANAAFLQVTVLDYW